ncbi:Uncharacterised protein [Escherichia coli]|nr:Uncharacterised protein [Escherichia coli]
MNRTRLMACPVNMRKKSLEEWAEQIRKGVQL